jgi:FemAB-related protein (PEP-CTERM system-associated)
MSSNLQYQVQVAAPSPVRPEVRAYAAADAPRWNAFVHEHPEGTFFHLAEWQQVLREAFGHRSYYLLAERAGEVVGVLPLALVSSALFGRALISTPFCVYGGIVSSDAQTHGALTEAACALAQRLNVDYLELRNRRRQHPQWPAKDLYVTFRKEIAAESEQNMLAIPRKQRAMVRKGIQKGLQSRIDANTADHYALYSESLRNLGTPVFARKYLDVLRRVFGEACEILTVTHEGTPVASVLSFYFRDEVLPYYGGGGAAARPVAANDFMYWEVMERARQRGLRVFDYGRSKQGTGSFDFKVHWGFEPTPLHYEYYLVRASSMPNLSPTNPSYSRAIGLWQRLPLWLTQLLGPYVARYLG